MSSHSANAASFSADSADDESEDAPNADIQVTGRNVEIPDHYRVYVGQKLSRVERLDRRIRRFDVELEHEPNRRQRKSCQHVQITTCLFATPTASGNRDLSDTSELSEIGNDLFG